MAEKPAAGADLGGIVDPAKMPGLKADRTQDEIVADVVNRGAHAEAPDGHQLSVEERNRRATEAAKREKADLEAFFNEPEEAADGDQAGDYDKGGEDTPVEPE